MRKGPKVLKASRGSSGTSAVKRSEYAKGCLSVTLKTSGLAKIPVPNLIKAKSQRATGFQRPMAILEENTSALAKMN